MTPIRKRFGQHFLHDQGVLDRIVDVIDPRADDHVVEIGPGPGALTERLLARVPVIDAVEIDRDLTAALRTRWPDQLRLHAGDALRFDFTALGHQRGGVLRMVGNLPYNISTPLLFHFLEHRRVIRDITVMLQKEVIDRVAAGPGDEDYGRLSVMLAPWMDVRKCFEVGPGAFRPPPRVWSAVATLTVLPEPRFTLPAPFAAVVAQAFSQRRKTLRNSLRAMLDATAIESAGIDPAARPETLAPEAFARLAALAEPHTP